MKRADPNAEDPAFKGTPGCALAVIHHGEIVYRAGYGMADIEHGVPIEPNSVFYAGSVSKQFVAASLLLLHEQELLNLDDPVHEHIPELPDYGYPITLRHLIHHTSGLRDYLSLWDLSGRNYLDHMPDEAVLDLIVRQRALNFPPGTAYSYSNTGYFLIKEIIERVSGQSLKDFAHAHIFQPLGMEHSTFNDDFHDLIHRRAHPYQFTGPGEVENLPMRFDLVGSGGLYTTVEDLYLWDQNFYDNRLGTRGQAFLDSLLQAGRLRDGGSTGYAFAMHHGVYRGLATVSHTGSMGGYRAYYLRIPDKEFSVILLGNFAEFTPIPFAQEIVDIVIDPTMPKTSVTTQTEEPEGRPHTLSEEQLKELPGTYYSDELNALARIWRHNNELHLKIGHDEPIRVKRWMRESPDNQFIPQFPAGSRFIFGAQGMRNFVFERFGEGD